MKFRYLRDPVFLAAVAIYFLNRFAIKPTPLGRTAFFHGHLNDLLCIPFWLPPLLFLHRRLGLRRHDGPPEWSEIAPVLLVWSFLFEVFAPRLRFLGSTADPLDIFFYALGALAAACLWNLYVGDREPANDRPQPPHRASPKR